MSSSLRFKAVNDALGGLYDKLKQRLLERRVAGRHELPNEEIDTFARTARVMAYNAVAEAHEVGRAEGRRAALEEMGVDPEGDPEDRPTRPTHFCPSCGQAHRRLNPSRPGTAGGAPR